MILNTNISKSFLPRFEENVGLTFPLKVVGSVSYLVYSQMTSPALLRIQNSISLNSANPRIWLKRFYHLLPEFDYFILS